MTSWLAMDDQTHTYQDEPLSDAVFHQFLALLHHQRQYSRQIENEQGITPRDFSVLRYLFENGPAIVSQIQRYLHKSPSTASTLIAQLEDQGYLTRQRSTSDNRIVIVSLTEKGQEVAMQAPFGGLPLLRRRLSALSDERLAEISSVLVEIMALMKTEDKP